MDAQGAIDSLLGGLTTVLVNEAQLLGGLRGDVEFINDEMESMNGLLLHLTDSHNRDNQVRAWMKQVVGLSRQSEGNVELYVQYVGGAGPGARKGLLGYLLRTLRFVRTMSARHRIATRIRELKIRSRDVGDRRKRYGVTVPPAPVRSIYDTPAPQPGGPEEEEDLRRRELLCCEPADTIEEDTNKVLECLFSKEDTNKVLECLFSKEFVEDDNIDRCSKRLHRLICIEGEGSVGKTTIARKVYDNPSVVSSFDHMIWINNGGLNRGVAELHSEILQQLPLQSSMNSLTEDDYDGLYLKACQLLADKSLLNVLDSVNHKNLNDPDLPAWFRSFFSDFGYFCFPEAPNLYTVVFRCATRPKYFRNRALDLAKCEGSAVVDVLVKCYQDTFAAQLFLRLLYVNPGRSTTELETICRAQEENKNNTAKAMLMFCYSELPSHYKSCLMYLSIFPQGHITMRTDLLRRWTAEGLITKRSAGMGTVDDQAERIFDSLVTRGFICPVETSAAGKIKSFTISHVVHDFIVTDVGFLDTSSRPELAHRLSINSGVAIQEETFSDSDPPGHGILAIIESLPQSTRWEFLKVLDLQGCKGLKKKHLNNICNILLLKYLSLKNTDVA
ncbi:hypothetical protein ACQ4PT_037736 [Festuca glaucescens]